MTKHINITVKTIVAIMLLQLKSLVSISLYDKYFPNITATKKDVISIKTILFPIIPVYV